MEIISQFAKRKRLTCFLAGAVAVLSLAPFYVPLVLFVSFPVLLNFLDNAQTKRESFWHGWWFGFGYFVFGLYWISNSLMVDFTKFFWLIPFALTLIPAAAAIFTGAVAYIYSTLLSGNKFANALLFASLWVAAELARTYIPFGGFPWNLIGYAGLFSTEFAQIAAIGGVYLLGFVIIIVSLIPYYKQNKIAVAAACIVVIATFVPITYATHVLGKKHIVIFQPNVEQTMKWDPQKFQNQFVENVEKVKAQNFSDDSIVIWPEASVPYSLNENPDVLDFIKEATPKNGLTILGALRSLRGDDGAIKEVWNSVYFISQKGIEGYYDKHHLVPFGEYVPFRKSLPLEKITPGALDFSTGGKPTPIKLAGVGFLPLICYEIIFPELANSDISTDFSVNITNDAWFGNSTGPQQHLAAARLRAIEQQRYVLRSANTGVSAIIASNGNVIKSLGYNQAGFIELDVPTSQPVKTIYSSLRLKLILPVIILSIVFAYFLRKKM